MKIVLDVFGADNSPHEIVKGAVLALEAKPNFSLILTGDEAAIRAELAKYKFDAARIEIVHAPDVITNNDIPTEAIQAKKESSMVKAFSIAKERADVVGTVTAGSTGAALAGAIMKLGRITGVRRPALAPLLPTEQGGNVCLIDCGANVDCQPEFLTQFALMGTAYMRTLGIENPRVALVSNGVEDKKGNELVQKTFPLLKELPINFVGNMEAREALSGKYDVLVCDGFVGNVLLKTSEGTANSLMRIMKRTLTSTLRGKIGGALVRKPLKKMMRSLGDEERGGSAFLGCSKLVVKAHGGSEALTIRAALLQVVKMAAVDLTGQINQQMARLRNEV
ncbi:MAG: phosphate acyltransferase PlsX [Firmicutes bacterium]|nr:phosphate acyltransferase PlsX [Bacillota bacterium]